MSQLKQLSLVVQFHNAEIAHSRIRVAMMMLHDYYCSAITSGVVSFFSEVLLDLDMTEDLLELLGVALSIRIVGTRQFAVSSGGSGFADSSCKVADQDKCMTH